MGTMLLPCYALPRSPVPSPGFSGFLGIGPQKPKALSFGLTLRLPLSCKVLAGTGGTGRGWVLPAPPGC